MENQGRRRAGWALVIIGVIGICLFLLVGVFEDDPDIMSATAPFAIAPGFIAVCGLYMLATKAKPSPVLPAAAPKLPLRRRNRMPAPHSAANQPMQGLAGAEAALKGLLGQLRDANNADPAWIANSWEVARRSAAEFQAVAGKLEAVEAAIDHTPPAERPALQDGVARLRTQLDDGLTAYQGMVAAASKMVLASAPASAANELTAAADNLATVAHALTELTQQYAWLQNR
jgi:hypothetical protein